ncbi:MAG: NUDIX domain-containing protein [Oscillospiraceae bacterium]|nr:NUDIX domain-containing protein [Oscillospiraceae bacterium]
MPRRDGHSLAYEAHEKSCGAVVYRKYHGNTEVLLVKHVKSEYWSFPKGRIEEGETEKQTAIREILEETGLDVFVDTGFRETVTYNLRRDTKKTVVYFVAKIKKNKKLIPQTGEISEIRWVAIDNAATYLPFENDRAIVNKAKAFITLSK